MSQKHSQQLPYEIITLAACRDVLSVSKKLTKEREEMCRDLGRLHESMLELHDKMIMELQVLAQENSSLRRGGQETQPR